MIKEYCGPKVQIQPEQLGEYDNGLWSSEEKHDGHWAKITTNENGKIISIIGRSGKTFSNENVRGLLSLITPFQNSEFASELEAGTEASVKKFQKIGFSRLHVFDVIKLFGSDTRGLPYSQRRGLLEIALKVPHDRLLITRSVSAGFKEFFNTISESGGEGLVLKRNDSKYDIGKTNNWIRCKRFRFVDYVVLEVGKSDGGSDNFQVGLFIEGKLQRVATIKNLPKEMKNPHAFVGKVVECRGVEVHDSGALRHGHFERLRNDKDMKECTLSAALNA